MRQDNTILLIFSAISLTAVVIGLFLGGASIMYTGSGMLLSVALFWLASKAIRAYRGQR